jgi:rod shape-determining protein MreD
VLGLLRLVLTLWVLVVAQTTVVPAIGILDARPDLPFLLVLLTALHEGAAGGALVAFVAGLFVDVNSPGTLGTTSLFNVLVAFGVGSMADRVVRDSLTARAAVALLATLLRDLLLVVTTGDEISRMLLRSVLPGALYTALLAAPAMAVLEKMVGWRQESGRGR